jgi:membrane-anchored protein YejM (alkaline phosphatase superfamily)
LDAGHGCEFQREKMNGLIKNKKYNQESRTTVINLAGRWFSPDTHVSSTNKTDHHNIAEILLNMALNIVNQTKTKPNIKGLKCQI